MPDALKITAPFTSDQVASLNGYQASGAFHEFTCGNDTYHGDDEESPVLVAEEDGWRCPTVGCGYRQNWAHAAMADWSWKAWRGITVQVDGGAPVRGEVASIPG